jgi:serine/threonine protein kinase
MEYLPLGDLQKYIDNPLKESEAATIAQQLLEGLAFMHENDFAHRDLKPAVNLMHSYIHRSVDCNLEYPCTTAWPRLVGQNFRLRYQQKN